MAEGSANAASASTCTPNGDQAWGKPRGWGWACLLATRTALGFRDSAPYVGSGSWSLAAAKGLGGLPNAPSPSSEVGGTRDTEPLRSKPT